MKTILPLALASGLGLGVFWFWYKLGDNRGYAPDQPIPFSHELHAGQLKIDCQYCHAAADQSRHATIPSMNVCMNCHSVVRIDSPHIQKMKTLIEQGDSLEWVKVHDVADFVFFSHKRHIAKGIACEKCHGKVERMQKVTQQERLNMGFCVECHRKEKAPTSCDTCHH
ncbi:MAG: cytochrome c3 family protein [Deltaproteobacteria bacterium]|nr:cytochrome c3 family protein [Deltaproteobacteria bacterium]